MRELPMPAFGGIIQTLPLVGNNNSADADQRVGNRRIEASRSKSWSKSRGHKSHGKKHGK